MAVTDAEIRTLMIEAENVYRQRIADEQIKKSARMAEVEHCTRELHRVISAIFPGKINFKMMHLPDRGEVVKTSEVLAIHASSGEVLAKWIFYLDPEHKLMEPEGIITPDAIKQRIRDGIKNHFGV